MTKIVVTEKATIELGTISLECYLLPNGEYRWSMAQISEAAGYNKGWLSGVVVKQSQVLESLQAMGFVGLSVEVKVPLSPGRYNTAKTISTESVMTIFKYASLQGKTEAINILIACLAETLERRADSIYGKKRTEEEYQEQSKARMLGKVTRRTYTDAIKAYLERHPEKSNSYCDYIYINVSDKINTLVFGMTAKQLRQHRGTTATLLRDTHSAAELQLIERIEDYAMRLIDKVDVEPMAAISDAYDFYS